MKWIRRWRWQRYMQQHPGVSVILCARCADKVGTRYDGGTMDLSKVTTSGPSADFTELYLS